MSVNVLVCVISLRWCWLGTVQCGGSTAVYGDCGERECGYCYGPHGRAQEWGNCRGSTGDSSKDHGEVDASTHWWTSWSVLWHVKSTSNPNCHFFMNLIFISCDCKNMKLLLVYFSQSSYDKSWQASRTW